MQPRLISALREFGGYERRVARAPTPINLHGNVHVTGSFNRPAWIKTGDEKVYDDLRAEFFRDHHPEIGNVVDYAEEQRLSRQIDEYLRQRYEQRKTPREGLVVLVQFKCCKRSGLE